MQAARAGRRWRQQGIALVYAVFFITIVALALALMARWFGVQTAVASAGLQQARALAAANAGISWQLYQIRATGNCPASQTLTLTAGALNGFAVTVGCSRSSALVEGPDTFYLYTLSARAQFGSYTNNPDYVSRQVDLTATL